MFVVVAEGRGRRRRRRNGAVTDPSPTPNCVRYSWTFDDVPVVVTLGARYDFRHHPKDRFTAQQLQDMDDKG